jgi:hypothetical protein
MNTRGRRWIAVATAALLASLAVVAWRGLAAWSLPTEYADAGRLPHVRPDYCQITIPPNIAPLNFLVEEPGIEYRVRIYGVAGKEIVVGSRGPSITIPPRAWRELLGQNRGGHITFEVYARDKEGRWSRFSSFRDEVAKEPIDSHLAYRRLGPVCSFYREMGIYQRDLESFDESPILTSDSVGLCMNCHSFCNNRPDTFSFQLRPGREKHEAGMIAVSNDRALRLKTQCKAAPRPPAYTSWHPSGSAAAFAMIHPRQYFHGAGNEIREVFDSDADLAVVNVRTGGVSTSPGVADPVRLETYPSWSADGKTLYFCSVQPLWEHDSPTTLASITLMYDLMCVSYDLEKDAWGQPEMVLSSEKTGLSISQPRASPDGRYLLFCMADYGTFPIHRSSSDLYLMDLKSREHRRLECNSRESDSWHCWSSNSRWIVFSSKRDNGLLARPYFCYIDAEGRERKPFVLPQKDPAFYDTWLTNYNVPELITGPVTISKEELLRAILSENVSTEEPRKPKSAQEGASPGKY